MGLKLREIIIVIIPIIILAVELLFHPLKKLYESWLNKRVEKHKADLQIKVEGHKIRLDKVSEICSRFVDLKNAMFELTQIFHAGPPPSEAELMRKAQKAAKDLLDTYDANKYCFDKATCQLMDELETKINKVWKDYRLSRMVSQDMVERSTQLFNNAHRIATEEIPGIIEQIQTKFRKLLGTAD